MKLNRSLNKFGGIVWRFIFIFLLKKFGCKLELLQVSDLLYLYRKRVDFGDVFFFEGLVVGSMDGFEFFGDDFVGYYVFFDFGCVQ